MEVNNIPKGVTWDYVENGVPTLTELGWPCYNAYMTEMPEIPKNWSAHMDDAVTSIDALIRISLDNDEIAAFGIQECERIFRAR